MLAGGPALARNGCLSSSAAVARWAGSRTSRRSRKPFRDGDTCREGVGGSVSGSTAHLPSGPRFPPTQGLMAFTAQGGAERPSASTAWPQGLTASPPS